MVRRLDALDDAKANAIPGVVAIVRDGGFVGVLAEREDAAIAAQRALRSAASWRAAHRCAGHSLVAQGERGRSSRHQ